MGRLGKLATQHSKGKIKKKPEKKTVQPTKRKNAPVDISFNESFFRALIEHSSNAITLLDSEGAVIYDSPAATGLLGYSPTEWIGKSVFELVHPHDLQNIQTIFQKLLKPKSKPANATFRLRRKDNSWMWIDAVATNLLAQPSVQAIVVNYRDITQHKNAEDRLVESEERFREVWESTSDAMVLSDAEGIMLAANPAYYNLYGYKPEHMLGQSFAIIFPEDFREYAIKSYKEIFKSDVTPTLLETVVMRADGVERIVESRASFLTSAGQRTSMLSTIRDITERKQAEDTLASNEKNFRTLIEHSSDWFVKINIDGVVTYVSEPMTRSLGYSVEEFIGTKIFDLIHSEDISTTQNLFAKLIQDPTQVVSAEYRLKHKDGSWRWVESIGKNLLNDPDIRAVIGNFRDSTERKISEQKLQTSESTLKLFVEYAPASIAMFDREMKYIAASKRYLLDYRLNVKDVVGRSHYEIFPEVPDRWKEIHQRCLSGVIEKSEEDIFPREDGSTDWVRWEIHPWIESNGEIGGIILFSEVITERKLAQASLHESEERFRLVVEAAPNAMIVVNKEGKIQLTNNRARDLFGYTSEDFLGKPIEMLVPERFRGQHTSNRNDFYLNPQTRAMGSGRDLFGLCKDGSEVPIEIGLVPFESENGMLILASVIDITERKQAEEIIRSERNFSNLALESLPGVFYMYDENRKFLRWNKNFEAVTGYTGDEIAGMNPLDFFNEQEKLLVDEKIEETFRNGSSWVEANFVAKDGTSTPYYFTGRTFILEGKTCLIGTGIDITERRKAEKALRNSEEQYRSLFEDSPIALWVEDFSQAKKRLDELKQNGITDIPAYIREHPDFVKECSNIVKILDVNHATVKLYHATDKSQLLGSLSTNSTPISPEQFEYELMQLANGRLHFDYEGIDQTLAGDKINVNIHWTVAPGYEADFSKIIVSTIDITERKKAEDKLQKQNQRLKVLREIDTAILATDSIESIGEAALSHIRELIGCERASLGLIDSESNELLVFGLSTLGVTTIPKGVRIPFELYPDWLSILNKNEAVILQDLNTMTNLPPQVQAVVKDGLRSICILPLFSQGKLIGTFSMSSITPNFFDAEKINLGREVANQVAIAITQNNLITATRELNIQLERRVAKRTAELNKTNLELEHANRAKDEFLANMSHELRTPLNSILGLSESMLEQYQDSLNENQQKSLQTIEASGAHLLDLINDILDLSKIEAGKFDYYPQPIRVDDLCKSSLIFVKTQAMKKGITLTYEIEDTISDFHADPRRLKQVLVNLLTNAVKFTPNDGHVTLKVNVKQDVIQFSVIDNGIGIAPDDLRKLFTPFVQVESSLNRQFEGTGLGLALVSKLTDLHGGSVEVESEVGKGSRFTINLPYRRGDLNQARETEKFTPHARDIQIDFQPKKEQKNKKILLVEDNATNILTIGEYLENYGYQIIIANDGLQAIEKTKEISPDIILMDIQMPMMDGLEATRRLRADPQFVSVPIIALTALAMPGDRERCLEAGASEYMSKPVSLKELRKLIELYFDSKQ